MNSYDLHIFNNKIKFFTSSIFFADGFYKIKLSVYFCLYSVIIKISLTRSLTLYYYQCILFCACDEKSRSFFPHLFEVMIWVSILSKEKETRDEIKLLYIVFVQLLSTTTKKTFFQALLKHCTCTTPIRGHLYTANTLQLNCTPRSCFSLLTISLCTYKYISLDLANNYGFAAAATNYYRYCMETVRILRKITLFY